MDRVTCTASPSLALTKYWGKNEKGLPATGSFAVTLGGLETRTTVLLSERDSVTINGAEQDVSSFLPFFDRVRDMGRNDLYFEVSSVNTFPTAAGIASSSSGYAALAYGCTKAADMELSFKELSRLARTGSVSASRAVFGGFVLLPEGADHARQMFGPGYWPELRILVAVVDENAKTVSSREAMEISKKSSPYYPAWLTSSRTLVLKAAIALEGRDLEALGEIMRTSYLRMHAAMMAGVPSVRYWQPASLVVQDACAGLRKRGVGAWETMDAGPQVKILCAAVDTAAVRAELETRLPGIKILESYPGREVHLVDA
jgi:diphosphomevalonate decarboxylase